MESNLLLFMMVAGISAANPKACGPAWSAYARQTGIDQTVMSYEKGIEKKVPNDAKFYIGNAVFITETVMSKQITFKWSFP